MRIAAVDKRAIQVITIHPDVDDLRLTWGRTGDGKIGIIFREELVDGEYVETAASTKGPGLSKSIYPKVVANVVAIINRLLREAKEQRALIGG